MKNFLSNNLFTVALMFLITINTVTSFCFWMEIDNIYKNKTEPKEPTEVIYPVVIEEPRKLYVFQESEHYDDLLDVLANGELVAYYDTSNEELLTVDSLEVISNFPDFNNIVIEEY